MAKPACLVQYSAEHGAPYTNGDFTPFCHVLRERNPDGTYPICGARLAKAVLEGTCLLDPQPVVTAPTEVVA